MTATSWGDMVTIVAGGDELFNPLDFEKVDPIQTRTCSQCGVTTMGRPVWRNAPGICFVKHQRPAAQNINLRNLRKALVFSCFVQVAFIVARMPGRQRLAKDL